MARIRLGQPLLHALASQSQPAVETIHEREPTVQIQHPAVTGGLMQPVDVLGDQLKEETGTLQPRQRGVGPVRERAL